MDYSEVTVYVLVSTETEEDSLRNHLTSLEESGRHVGYFFDPDECIESLISTHNQKYLLILGSGKCHLVDILSTIPCIFYIYLTENHDFEDASHVRGIYSKPQELIEKIRKDIKMIEDNILNYSISSSTEANMFGTSTKDIQADKLAFSWSRVILHGILNVRRPTENVYGEMLKECRHIYQEKNKTMCQKIDDFEKTYDSKNAIFWYTKDSFLYRQVNAAFRTENILTIWKFRFVIQDIYKRLELLHEQQTKNPHSTSSKVHHLYRGQHMTPNELKQIKDNVGHMIAINSFLSTSLDYNLAKTCAGNGEDRATLESVIFHIIINEREFENVPIIFANITFESNFEEEKEVLLAMGTILRIESVKLEGNIWKICLHAYPYDDAFYQNIKTLMPDFFSSIAPHDEFALLTITGVLLEMGHFEKAEQILYQQTTLCENPFNEPLRNLCKVYINLYRIGQKDRSIQPTELNEILHKAKEFTQQLKQSISPNDYRWQKVLEMYLKRCDLVMQLLSTWDWKSFDILRNLGPQMSQIISQRELFSSNNEMVLSDSSIKDPTELTDVASQDNETYGLMNCDEMQSAIDRNFVKNDPRRIGFLYIMANNHTEKKEYDKAIRCLRDALLIPCNDNARAATYSELAKVYERQQNWPAALECHENTISMLQSLKSSSKLALVHLEAGDMYREMEDHHNAIVHYKRGVQLYCQHESPHHPIVSSYKIVIGSLFEKLGDMDAALKTFQEVFELGHPDKTKVAYQRISTIYVLKDDYDMAYYNLIESLEIAQREIPPNIDFIIDIHLDLFRIEIIRKNYDDGYNHINEAIVMSKNHQCTEETQKEIQSALKMFSDMQRPTQPHNRK